MHKIKIKKLLGRLLTGFLLLALASHSVVFAATTTPATLNYQGRLLNNSSNPLTGNYTFRFSLWNSADWQASDTNGAGAIDVASPRYAGWQETHAVTTGTYGLFNISLGSGTALPNFVAGTHDYLQVEVKATGAADTTYEILDPQGTTADTVDRKTIHDQAYAENADTIDNREIGTNAGDIAVLGAGGVWSISQVPGGTDANSFVINNNDGGDEDVTLQFGNDTTDGTITWDDGTSTLTVGDGTDSVAINSNTWDITGAGVASGLTGLTSTGAIDFSGASRLALHQGAANPGTCTEGDIFYNTTGNTTYVCTAANTWTALSSGAQDFESVYGADGDNTLTTSNGDFTVNSGTGDVIIASNDWGVDANGNITTNGTVDGVDLSNLQFSDLGTRVKKVAFEPEYDSMVIEPDGTNNRGKLIYDFIDLGGADKRNFYHWTTQQGALQDLDLVISYQLPLDFVSFTGTPLQLTYQTSNGVTATNEIDLALYDTTGTVVALTGGSNLANAAWTTANVTFGGGETFTAGQTITLRIKLATTSAGFARVSDLVFNYNGR